MPRYEITSPDGRKFEITAPEGASQAEVLAYAQSNFTQSAPPIKTTAFGNVKEAFKGLVPGAVNLLESAATGASALLPEDMEKSAREKIKSVATAAKAPFAAAPGYENTVPRKLSEAVGSTAPFLLAGPFGLAGRAAAVGLGVGAGAGESRTRAEESGATGDQRSTATALGILPGALEAFAPIRILSRIPTASKVAGVETVKRALVAGGEEAAQEAASGFAQNLIAKGVYKPEQALIEGLGEQAAYGGATGAIVQGLMDLALGRRPRGAQPTQETPPPAEQPARAPEATPEKPLQLGSAPPFVPRALPDGSVATTQAELDAYDEQKFEDKYKPQRVRPPEQLTLPGMEGLAPAEPTDLFGNPLARAEDEAAPRASDLLEGVPLTTDVLRDAGMAPSPKEAVAAGQQPLGLRRTPEGQPTASGEPEPTITSADIMLTAVPVPKGVQGWLEKNVVGSTRAQLDALIAKDPTLVQGSTPRAKILRSLTATEVPAFKETPRVEPTPTETPAVEQRDEPRASEPSVDVPSEPAAPIVPEPRARVPRAAKAPAAPDGRGLVPAGQPAVQGDEAPVGEPVAVTAEAEPAPAPVVEPAPAPSVAPQSPDVDSIKSFPVGPSRVTPTVIARDKPTYHETNAEGLEDFARNDKQFEYSGAFVSDNPDLALGQGSNTGVFLEFRPNSVSGRVNAKLGTSPATGQEYKSDVVAPKAISVVTIKDPASFKPGRMTARLLKAEFDKETLPDGSVQYTRKGVTASKALPITQAPEVEPTAPIVAPTAPAPKVEPSGDVTDEDAPKDYEKAPAIVTLSQAKTKAQLESALDEIARIRRDPAHVDHAAVNAFLEDTLAAPGFEPMFTAALDRTRPRQAPAAPAAPAEEKKPRAIKPIRAVPSAFFEPIGVDARTGAVKRGKQMLVQPIDDKRAAEYLKAKEQADEGDTSELTALFEEIEREGDVPDTQGALFDTEGKVTKEAKVKTPKAEAKPEPVKAEPVKAEPVKAEPVKAEPTPTKEVTQTAASWGGDVLFFDGAVGIIGRPNPRTGELEYIPIQADGTYSQNFFGIQSVDALQKVGASKVFSPAEMATLVAQTADLKIKDTKAEAAFPDGPFTGAKSNVVAGKSVDSRYTNYLTDLMKSMGLGDVRVFLYHSADVAGNADKLHIHGSYYPIMARGVADKSQKGGTRSIGPENKDFMLFIKDGMSETETLEILTHELGHMIQDIAFNSAPTNVQDAIKDAHDKWLKSVKGGTVEDMIRNLRNRDAAEMAIRETDPSVLKLPVSKLTAKNSAYWLGFNEWFADNVSRWATTSDKPLTVADKFFSRVAQMMRDLVAVVTGRKYPPQKQVADFLDKMGPGSADTWLAKTQPAGKTVQPIQNAVSYTTEQLVDSMGPMERQEKSMLRNVIDGFKAQDDIGYGTKFRTQTADSAAAIEYRLREQFDGAVKDKLGKFNPMGLYRQAQDYSKMLMEYMQVGGLAKEPATGLWKVKSVKDPKTGKPVRPPVEVYALIDKWAAKNGYSRERGTQIASRVLEGVRLDSMRASNKNDGTSFLIHLKDNEIDQLVREYKADPDLQAMSKAMDEARIAMVDNMVKVGRLTKETGDVWKETVGYVPFDRLEDEKFAAAFSKVKKISNKGLAQVGKLPELVGSEQRPVGNVFENYLNTLGWMVGQTMKTDATVQTLRSLEDAGHAKFLHGSTQQKPNTVGMYVDGEMKYWELPSKYDVMAFKDLNPPKAKWLQVLGQASNILRKAVTVLPPFALKQVTDDVQRAIMTSGVRNPGALLRMTLSNFGGLALAELRGIQHPTVKEFGALGLTGEYDFQQGKPATSVLKDLGYKPRGRYETLIHRLDGITRASDLAVRKAIYDQTMKESQGDQLLAQTRAREFINFRRRGASDFVGAMVTTIPFFNAYIQGMDVLYRAASGKDSSSSVDRAQARRMFYSRAAIAMTLSSLYALGKGDDDEDYNEMDLRTRDSNWILPGGFKLPVPSELGALFKVIPERIVEYMRRQGTPEEQTAWEATRTALAYIMEQYVGRTVPVPQGVKPLLEAWTNYSFFTGRELEGIYQKQQDPSLRRASNTSELAIAIANFSKDVIGVDKVSPILIDNALSGYFGSTAGLLVAMTDSLLNPTRVDRPLHKYALVSNYLYDPVGTRRMTEFYDEREKVGRANTTLRELMKTDLDKAAEYAEKNAEALMLESAVNSTLEQLERTRAYRKYLNGPLGAEDMSKEEREASIKEVKQMEVELTSWLREAKTSMRQ